MEPGTFLKNLMQRITTANAPTASRVVVRSIVWKWVTMAFIRPTKSPGTLPGFVVERFTFDQFVMKGTPIEEWLRSRTPEQKASFENDKEKL